MKKSIRIILLIIFPALINAQAIKILFPGDTNNDGVCNHYDLLPIGLKYNQTFEPRDLPSLDWMPQPFLSWMDSLPVSEVNTGFADCDGNGLVDDLDLDALLLNYDSTQNESVPPPTNWLAKLTDTLFSMSVPRLRLDFDKDIAFPGDTLLATLSYSMPLAHPTQALGLAVWFTFPPENVVNTEVLILPDTMNMDLMYVGATSNEVNIWRALAPGNIQFAAAARGQNDLTGDDTLAQFRIIIEDKIIAMPDPFMFQCEEVLLINAMEQVIPIEFEKDSVVLDMQMSVEQSGTRLVQETTFFPNPFVSQFTLDCPEPIEEIVLTDHYGRSWRKEVFPKLKTMKSDLLASLPPGHYFLKIITEKGTIAKAIQKL